MPSKTHQTAVAIVPPQEVWGPIQAIREKHDRQFRRWMPHVNLFYPFYQPERFAEALPCLVEVCAKIAPFLVSLTEFKFFWHPSGKVTLWLAPEPREALDQLQAALQAACPSCDDLSRFSIGFTPHLSVGQANSAEEARKLQNDLQHAWKPPCFELSAVAVLRRGRNSPFEIDRLIPLAGSGA